MNRNFVKLLNDHRVATFVHVNECTGLPDTLKKLKWLRINVDKNDTIVSSDGFKNRFMFGGRRYDVFVPWRSIARYARIDRLDEIVRCMRLMNSIKEIDGNVVHTKFS